MLFLAVNGEEELRVRVGLLCVRTVWYPPLFGFKYVADMVCFWFVWCFVFGVLICARIVSGNKLKEHTVYKNGSTAICEKFSFIL